MQTLAFISHPLVQQLVSGGHFNVRVSGSNVVINCSNGSFFSFPLSKLLAITSNGTTVTFELRQAWFCFWLRVPLFSVQHF